jgi:excisionase family DNA binding protein
MEPKIKFESTPAVMSVQQFCRDFGVSHTTFYELKKNGQLKAVKVGRRTLVRFDEAQRWLNSL